MNLENERTMKRRMRFKDFGQQSTARNAVVKLRFDTALLSDAATRYNQFRIKEILLNSKNNIRK